jgi:hypothetical protein
LRSIATAGTASAQPATAGVCPFCGGEGRHAFLARDRNREVTQARFEYARCGTCETVFIVAVPADLDRYYGGGYYHFDPDGEPSWKSNQTRLDSASFRVRLVRDQVAPGDLIEIGAGTGAFAVTAKAAGFNVSAIEMDEGCCRYLSEEGVEAICSDQPLEALARLPSARAVALWHVLEHLPNPAEVLAGAAEKLESGGVLAIGVPNSSSVQFRLLGRRWPHLDAPRHLSLIPPDALIERGRDLGLRCVATTTTDPEGLEFNLFGWAYALRRRPAEGPLPRSVGYAAAAVARVAAPLERRGLHGSTVTLVMRKES